MDFDNYDAVINVCLSTSSNNLALTPCLIVAMDTGSYSPNVKTFQIPHLSFQTQGGTWFKPSEETVTAGICLRIEKDHFRVFPYDNQFLAPFEAAVRVINPLVAIKIRNAAVHAAFYTVYAPIIHFETAGCSLIHLSTDESDAIFVDADTRIQVLDTMSHLAAAEKEQCAAFLVRQPRRAVLMMPSHIGHSVMNVSWLSGLTLSTISSPYAET